MIRITTVLFALTLTTSGIAQLKVPNGNKIEFVSEDESFAVTMGFRFQNLFTMEASPEQFTRHPEIDVLVRRSRFKFDGYLIDTTFSFKFEMGMANSDIGARQDFTEVGNASRVILDAVAQFKVAKGLEIWFGQTKLPGNRERVISSQKLQFVDRSLLNSRFNIDRDVGFQLHYSGRFGKQSVYRLVGSVSMGEGRNITVGNSGGLDYTGRLEYLPFGQFVKSGDYFSADLKREEKPKLSIGATLDYNDNASRQMGQLGNFVTDTLGNPYFTDLRTLFLDAIFKYKGFSFQCEYAYKSREKGMMGGEEEGVLDLSNGFLTGTSETFQVGYMLPHDWELALRYAATHPEDELSVIREEREYTAGLSHYIVGHTIKMQSDISLRERVGLPIQNLMYRFQIEFGF